MNSVGRPKEPIREAWLMRFGIKRWRREQWNDYFLSQLSFAKDDATRRILIRSIRLAPAQRQRDEKGRYKRATSQVPRKPPQKMKLDVTRMVQLAQRIGK